MSVLELIQQLQNLVESEQCTPRSEVAVMLDYNTDKQEPVIDVAWDPQSKKVVVHYE